MNTKVSFAFGVALTATVLAVWDLGPNQETTQRGERAAVARDVIARTDFDRVSRELLNERKKRRALQREIADLTALKAGPQDAAEPWNNTAPETKTAPRKTPRFVYEEYRGALNQIDWQVVGESMNAIPRLLAEVHQSIQEGKPLPPSVGELQRHSGALITQALTLQAAGVPGTAINGVFTHPVAQVNVIHATLIQAGTPLHEQQQEELSRLGARFLKEDQRRLADYDTKTMALKKVIEETALKERFFTAVDQILTTEQREVLHAHSNRGYTSADLFSSGMVWAQVARPTRFSSREDLESAILGRFTARLRLTDSSRGLAKPIVAAWVSAFSNDYLTKPITVMVRRKVMEVSRIELAAHAQLDALHALMTQIHLSPEQQKGLRDSPVVLVPYLDASRQRRG